MRTRHARFPRTLPPRSAGRSIIETLVVVAILAAFFGGQMLSARRLARSRQCAVATQLRYTRRQAMSRAGVHLQYDNQQDRQIRSQQLYERLAGNMPGKNVLGQAGFPATAYNSRTDNPLASGAACQPEVHGIPTDRRGTLDDKCDDITLGTVVQHHILDAIVTETPNSALFLQQCGSKPDRSAVSVLGTRIKVWRYSTGKQIH